MARIAIVLNASWNVYNFRLPLIEYFANQDHQIFVIAPEDKYSNKIPFPFFPLKMQPSSLNPLADLMLIKDLYSIFRLNQIDIALLYTIKPNIYANFAAWLSGVKTISNISGLGNIFINKRLTTSLVKFLYRTALKIPATVFFQNQQDQHFFIQHRLVNKSKCSVIPGSGIDIEKYAAYNYMGKKGSSKFTFLIVARMLWDKGIAEYIDAGKIILKQRGDVEFKLLGQSDSENPTAISHQTLLTMTHDKAIEYIGFTDNVKEQMCKADCIVLPSYREGLSRVLLEASSLALPIITSNVPGCNDVVEDGINGLLCEPKDALDLSYKMLEMLNLSIRQRADLGISGRKKAVQLFDQQIVFTHYQQAINKILKNNV